MPALTLLLRPTEGDTFEFAAATGSLIEIENGSERAVVVTRIAPHNLAADPMALSGSVYGSVSRLADQDAYVHNAMSQQETGMKFHSGLLLPGERLVLRSDLGPTSRVERLDLAYHQADRPFDGTASSLEPFTVYLPRSPDELAGLETVFVPFSKTGWDQMRDRGATAGEPGPGNPPRAVLIPGLGGPERSHAFDVAVRYRGPTFPLEDARLVASRIQSCHPDRPRLAFSRTFGAYVVFERDVSWLLASADQSERGRLLAVFPPSLLRDLDAGQAVRVRVGEKQEGFGPSPGEAPWKLWDTYPVSYGDGVYTHGEFVHLDAERAVSFLEQARRRGASLGAVDYFFRSRYYTLQVRPDARENPAVEGHMERYIIRKIPLAHCKRGPAACEKCRQMDVERICLLDIHPPGEGQIQRRIIQVDIGGERVWREFDIVRAFETEEEARRYAAAHGIADAEF